MKQIRTREFREHTRNFSHNDILHIHFCMPRKMLFLENVFYDLFHTYEDIFLEDLFHTSEYKYILAKIELMK